MKRKEFLSLAAAAAAAPLLNRCSGGGRTAAGPSGATAVTVKLYDLKLKQAWGLSRGTWTTRRNAFVRIEKDGVFGIGEAAPIARYSETAESAAAFIEKARPVLDRDLGEYAVRFGEIEAAGPGEHAAKAALDMAILDWAGPRNIGFSTIVSLGNAADLDFGDILDYLAMDPQTDAILLYIEGIRNSRAFMSGLRAAARMKPVIVNLGLFAERLPIAALVLAALAAAVSVPLAMAIFFGAYAWHMFGSGVVAVVALLWLSPGAAGPQHEDERYVPETDPLVLKNLAH